MFAEYFDAAGPILYAVFAAWVIVFAGVLERLWFALLGSHRRCRREVERLVRDGWRRAAMERLERERSGAERGLARIESVSQLATSLGLFGTVWGLAQSFLTERSAGELALAAPEALAAGLSTALFSTIGGLVVFLFGQAFLIVWREWRASLEAPLLARIGPAFADVDGQVGP